MKRFALLLLLVAGHSFAQSIPNGPSSNSISCGAGSISLGQIWTDPQWAEAWTCKADVASPALTGTPTVNGVGIAPIVSPAFTGAPTVNSVAIPSPGAPLTVTAPWEFSGVGIGTSAPTNGLALTQAANGDLGLTLQRFTDTSPTGDLLVCENAAGNQTLCSIDVNGNIVAASIALNSPTGGSEGAGTINVSAGYYVNGIPVPTYPRTAAEIAASVTPVDYTVAPCNVNRYATNATPGTTDMSTAFQNATSACTAVFVPAGLYLVGGVTLPNTYGLTIYGEGNASVIQQKTTGGIFGWNASAVVSGGQYIHDLYFNTLSGTANAINTTGTQILKLEDLYFSSCPTGADCIYLNGAASTTAHDNNLSNIQIYNGSNAANAGIELGPLQFDTTLSHVWMNGNFNMSYGIELDSGASAIKVIDSSPYNMKTSDLIAANNNNYIQLTHNVFGPTTTGDLVSITGSSFHEIVNNFFESIPSGFNGLKLIGTTSVSVTDNVFLASSGAGYAVVETSAANYTSITGGGISGPSNFTSGIFNLIGANSSACNVPSPSTPNINCLTRTSTYAVSTLPACNSGTTGASAYVTDATSPTYNGALTGGGTVKVPVACNGSSWTSH